MKRGKLLIGVLYGFLTLFAFSSSAAYAIDFDAENAYQSIFVVYSGSYEGSGFAIGSNTVVTNAHVIGNANDIRLSSYEGDVYRASVYLIDNSFDIAILSVKNAEFTPLEISDCESLKVGEDIYAIGAPKSLEYTLTKGVVSSKERQIGVYKYIQIDAAINSGNSGGPLLNNSGKVVGVNSMKISDAEGIGLAIPISSVVSFIEKNGVAITEENAVDGEIPYIEGTPKNTSDDDSIEITHRETSSGNGLAVVLGIALAISVMLNVLLIIILVYRRNKNDDRPAESSERTDFDIDILG